MELLTTLITEPPPADWPPIVTLEGSLQIAGYCSEPIEKRTVGRVDLRLEPHFGKLLLKRGTRTLLANDMSALERFDHLMTYPILRYHTNKGVVIRYHQI